MTESDTTGKELFIKFLRTGMAPPKVVGDGGFLVPENAPVDKEGLIAYLSRGIGRVIYYLGFYEYGLKVSRKGMKTVNFVEYLSKRINNGQ